MRRQIQFIAGCALLACVPANAWAQPGPSSAEDAAARQKLNQEQADLARKQLEQNAASARAHDEAVRTNAEEYRRQQEAYEAEKLRRERDHEDAMAHWRADVAACEAGDKTRCAAPTAPQGTP